MARSLKKGPFVNNSLLKKILEAKASKKKIVIKLLETKKHLQGNNKEIVWQKQ